MSRPLNFNIPVSESLEKDYRSRSFWMETLPNLPVNEPVQGSQRCDIAIIGGGFTGLSAAYHAQKLLPGARIRVIEANRCGFGSSGRNAGFSTTLFGMAKSITAMRFGKENAIAAHHYMEDAVDYVAKIIKEHTIDCDYEKSGSMLVATTPAQVKRIENELQIAEQWGLEGIESRNKAQLAEEFGSGNYYKGMFDNRSGLLNPARFIRGLMRIAEETGVVVHEMSPVTSIKEVPGGFQIHTPEGELHADKMVFATNAYSTLFPNLSAKQTPTFTYIILSEPLTDNQLASIGWQSRCGLEDARSLIHYYRLTADNRILMGGGDINPIYNRNFNHDSNKKVFAKLENQVNNIFPQLKGLKFTHHWGGAVSLTTDMAPAIGFIGKNKRAIYSLGLMGHGVSMAPYNGLCIAELLANKKSKRTEMFFVGRRIIPWPTHLIRYPILRGVSELLKLEDRLRG
jgi:glycine/D-amino acid oxidase-like deaminating enzyme